MVHKFAEKRENFAISHEKYILNQKKEEELRDEKIFKKYEAYVSSYYLFDCIFIIFCIYSIL